MSNPLRDQLLKKGIVTKKQAKAAKHAETIAEAARRKGAAPAEDDPKARAEAEARKALEEKAARDREINREREARRAEEARLAEARDIIRKHKVRPERGGVAYHFPDEGTVRTIRVSAAQQRALAVGALAIVLDGDDYVLLTEEAAEKLLDRAPELIVCFNEPPSAPDPDDPYAEHPVPDDLMW